VVYPFHPNNSAYLSVSLQATRRADTGLPPVTVCLSARLRNFSADADSVRIHELYTFRPGSQEGLFVPVGPRSNVFKAENGFLVPEPSALDAFASSPLDNAVFVGPRPASRYSPGAVVFEASVTISSQDPAVNPVVEVSPDTLTLLADVEARLVDAACAGTVPAAQIDAALALVSESGAVIACAAAAWAFLSSVSVAVDVAAARPAALVEATGTALLPFSRYVAGHSLVQKVLSIFVTEDWFPNVAGKIVGGLTAGLMVSAHAQGAARASAALCDQSPDSLCDTVVSSSGHPLSVSSALGTALNSGPPHPSSCVAVRGTDGADTPPQSSAPLLPPSDDEATDAIGHADTRDLELDPDSELDESILGSDTSVSSNSVNALRARLDAARTRCRLLAIRARAAGVTGVEVDAPLAQPAVARSGRSSGRRPDGADDQDNDNDDDRSSTWDDSDDDVLRSQFVHFHSRRAAPASPASLRGRDLWADAEERVRAARSAAAATQRACEQQVIAAAVERDRAVAEAEDARGYIAALQIESRANRDAYARAKSQLSDVEADLAQSRDELVVTTGRFSALLQRHTRVLDLLKARDSAPIGEVSVSAIDAAVVRALSRAQAAIQHCDSGVQATPLVASIGCCSDLTPPLPATASIAIQAGSPCVPFSATPSPRRALVFEPTAGLCLPHSLPAAVARLVAGGLSLDVRAVANFPLLRDLRDLVIAAGVPCQEVVCV
jgi:hypothetical protein